MKKKTDNPPLYGQAAQSAAYDRAKRYQSAELAQLRAWVADKGACPAHLITEHNLKLIGIEEDEARAMVAWAKTHVGVSRWS